MTRRLATSPLRRCEVGDRLYVRESWRVSPDACDGWLPDELRGWIDYQAGGSLEVVAPSFDAVVAATFLKTEDHDWDFIPSRYRPSIHMPRWASRLTLIVEGVRVERVQDISEADAGAEGVYTFASARPMMANNGKSDRELFVDLWDSLHTKPGEGWEDNPFIVALTFRVEHRNIDAPDGGEG